MGQQAVITLNTLTYSPSGMDKGWAVWTERSGGIGTSFSVLKQRTTTNSATHVTVIEGNLNIPVVAKTDSTCACTGEILGTDYANLRVGVRKGASPAERTDLYLRIKDYVNSDAFKFAIENLDPVYG